MYNIIQPLALTQRNNCGPSLKLRAQSYCLFWYSNPLLNLFRHSRQITVPNLTRLPITQIRWQLTVWWCWLPADDSLSQYELSDTDGAIELESPRYRSEAATEVATVVAVLNVPKVAEILSPPTRPVANRKDCVVVVVVWVVPLATDARAGSYGGQFGCTFTCNSS